MMRNRLVLAYGFAVFAAAVATVLSLILAVTINVELPFIFGICAVLTSTTLGGAGPGVLAAAAALGFELLVAHATHRDMGRMLEPATLCTVLLFDVSFAAAGEAIHRLQRKGESQARRLREQEAHLRSIFDGLPAAMLVIDARGRISAASAAAGRLFGYPVESLLGMQAFQLLPGSPRAASHEAWEGSARTGAGETVAGRMQSGQLITLRLAHAWAQTSEGRLLTLMAHDVTNELADAHRIQELQTELIHVARFTALGEMGTAVAHELNQPLSAAANYLGAARRMLPQGEAGEDGRGGLLLTALQEAGDEVLRAGVVLRRLRTFVSRSGAEQRDVEVRELLMEAVLLARLPVRDARAEFKVDIEPKVGRCRADRVQIQQVILNLVRNAAEAIADTGPRRVELRAWREGDEVIISVRDTGPGVPAHIAPRLFERFNTSKADGMGVGLAISRTIVEAHGGRIWLEHGGEAGGADFRFSLPHCPDEEAADGG